MPTRSLLPTLLVGLVLLVLTSASVVLAPTGLAIGRGDSAVPDHLWGLWVTAEGFFAHGPYLRDTSEIGWPEGFRALQYEAPNLLGFLPGYWLGGGGVRGAVLGWNLTHIGAVLLAVFGCWRLGRRWLGAEPQVALLSAGFAGSAFFALHPTMGHSEYLAVALYPLHLSWLGAYLEEGRPRHAALAAVSLGLMGATASYLPVFLAVIELPVAIGWGLRAGPWRRSLLRLVVVAVPAVVLVLGFVWAMTWPWPLGHGAFAGQAAVGQRPTPELSSVLHGLLRLWPGSLDVRMNEQPGYPGLVLLVLALVGTVRAPRSALPWLVAGLSALALSAGPDVMLGGRPVPLPAGVLTMVLSPLRSVHWWERLGCLTPLPLGVAALHALPPGAWRRTLALCALMLLDQGSFPERGWPWPSFDLSPPTDLLDALEEAPEGAVLELPLPLVHLPGRPVSTGAYLMWQPQHGRPITTVQTLQADRLLDRSYLVRVVGNRQGTRPGRVQREAPGSSGSLRVDELACARNDAALLAEEGLASVVLHTRLSGGRELEGLLQQVLGEPHTFGTVRRWDLVLGAQGDRCLPPPLVRALLPVVPPPLPPEDRR